MQEAYFYLTEIIPDFPMVHIGFIGDEDFEIIKFLSDFSAQKQYIFDIKLFDKSDKIKTNVQIIDILSPRYHGNEYKYDTLFLNLNKIQNEYLEHIFQRVYAAAKNSGGIVIFVPQDDDFALEIEEFLENLNFVAINYIDTINDKKIFYAKKMHGWGGAR